ncbi:MAG: hypothetical protein JWO25_1143 [Alphaproteobacteria bacterium]|nr:hypothetical protein [Alphaproteobacteria bacterium]MDB5720644.1 hypothetical protein [Alphaproteobacteria bacterium]
MRIEKSKLSRRSILAGLVVGAGTVGAVAVAALNRGVIAPRLDGSEGSWWTRRAVALENAGLNDWTSQIGADFDIGTPEAGGTFKLVKVEPFLSPGIRPVDVSRDRAFMVAFEGSGEIRPEGDRIYQVKHMAGTLDIYFSAADTSLPTPRLQAVFN